MNRHIPSLAIGLAMALPALASATEPATAKVDVTVEVSEQEALEDDILLAIDLPILVADARDAGIDEEELEQVVSVAAEAGLSPAVTAELVTAETETTKEKGKRRGLSIFVHRQLAKGVPPGEIAKKVRDREEALEEMTPEERAALEARIEELRDLNKRRKKALQAKRKELRAAGKELQLIAREAHAARKAALLERRAELEQLHRDHREARRDHREAREDALEARDDRLEARDDRHEAREDMKAARDDLEAAQTPEERREAAKDLRDAKKDLRDAKHDHKDAKHDHKAAKDDLKAAKQAHKDAHKDAKKGAKPPGNKGKKG